MLNQKLSETTVNKKNNKNNITKLSEISIEEKIVNKNSKKTPIDKLLKSSIKEQKIINNNKTLNLKKNTTYYIIGTFLILLIIFRIYKIFLSKSVANKNQILDLSEKTTTQTPVLLENSNPIANSVKDNNEKSEKEKLKDQLKGIITRMLEELKNLELDFSKPNIKNLNDLTTYKTSKEFEKLPIVIDKLQKSGEKINDDGMELALGKFKVLLFPNLTIRIEESNKKPIAVFNKQYNFFLISIDEDSSISSNILLLNKSNDIKFRDNNIVIKINGNSLNYKIQPQVNGTEKIVAIEKPLQQFFCQLKPMLAPRIDKIILDLNSSN